MLIFILKRIVAAIPVLFIVTLIAFSLIYMIPGDAAVVAAGDNATPERIQQVREQMGLDRPAIVQYFVWMGDLLRGNLGTSLISGHSNSEMIAAALPVTVSLALVALTWSLIAGVIIGTFAGLTRGSWIDRTLTALTTFGLAVPTFWIGLILVVTFALQLKMFPATGFSPISEGVGPWLSHLILPALALGTTTAAEIARPTRAGMIDVLDQDYIRTATAKGLPRWIVVGKHTTKNAAIPVVTVFGLQAAALIGGSVIIEQVFAMPGLGSLALRSIMERDFPVIQAFVVIVTLFVLLINLLVDISYAYFNPKVRQS